MKMNGRLQMNSKGSWCLTAQRVIITTAVAAAEALGGSIWVVKAQVHAGGRGKAGGVKLAKDTASVRAAAAAMLLPVRPPESDPPHS